MLDRDLIRYASSAALGARCAAFTPKEALPSVLSPPDPPQSGPRTQKSGG